MSLLARFDLAALCPPAASDAALPGDLLAWCRQPGPASRETQAGDAALDALMRELDGDRALQALPTAAARLRWRLALKLREALGQRRADDPWDAGWLRDVDALRGFAPRRPTLIVARPAQAAARALIAAGQPQWRHPVRLLISARPSPSGT